MSETHVIMTVLERTARRRRWQTAWHGFWLGLFVGACVWGLALALYKVFPLSVTVLPGAALVAGVLLAIGFGQAWWRPATLLETARWVDDRQRLQERLSTALELVAATAEADRQTATDGKPQPELGCDPQPKGLRLQDVRLQAANAAADWRMLLVRDAAKHASRLDPRRLLPFHLPGVTRWTLLVLAVGAGLGFVPEYRSRAYLQKQQDAAIIREMGRELGTLTRRSLTNHPPALQTTRRALDTINELGNRLQRASLVRDDALKELASVTEQLKEQTRQLARNPTLRRLEQAARAPEGTRSPAEAGLQKQIQELQKALGNQALNPSALDRLRKQLANAQRAAAALAADHSSAGAAARDQLRQSLSSLSAQAKSLGLSLPNLDAAMAALNAAQPDLVLKNLDASLVDLDKLRRLAKALQQLEVQAQKLGRDLAEQLKQGQINAAAATLRKMIDQLKSPSLSPQQLQAILNEVSQAVDPAGDYGKVAEYLKQAVGQMRQRRKPDAAQSLAKAAEQLNKLANDAGDLQSLIAALEALKYAELSVGNGR